MGILKDQNPLFFSQAYEGASDSVSEWVPMRAVCLFALGLGLLIANTILKYPCSLTAKMNGTTALQRVKGAERGGVGDWHIVLLHQFSLYLSSCMLRLIDLEVCLGGLLFLLFSTTFVLSMIYVHLKQVFKMSNAMIIPVCSITYTIQKPVNNWFRMVQDR